MPDAVQVSKLTLHRQRQAVLQDLSMTVREGECLGIIGPNGSGKSSLLQALLGFLPASEGEISLFGQDLRSFSSRARARLMACVMQDASAAQQFTVDSFLRLAYFPWQDRLDFRDWEKDSLRLCEEFDLSRKRDRTLLSLSGGERQRVFLVQSLLQRPRILLLDELTNHLDIAYQLETLQHLAQLKETKVMVLHDINLALRFCDRVLLLKEGKSLGVGPAVDLINETTMREIFGISCEIIRREGRIPYVVFGDKA